jgi:hypothetical protein
MSASVKPRLAGRQPSDRGGVPRVMTGPAEQASAGLAQGKAPEILRGLYVLLLSNDEPLSRVAMATP